MVVLTVVHLKPAVVSVSLSRALLHASWDDVHSNTLDRLSQRRTSSVLSHGRPVPVASRAVHTSTDSSPSLLAALVQPSVLVSQSAILVREPTAQYSTAEPACQKC